MRGDSVHVTERRLARLARGTPGGPARPQRVAGFDGGEQFVWLSSTGEDVARAVMGVPRKVQEVPYWGSYFQLLGAPSRSGTFAATNLFYPIRIFGRGGVLLDSLTEPPPSWRQARQPSHGEFPPEKHAQFAAYLQSFTIITGLAAVDDSVLIVAHGSFQKHPLGRHGRLRWDEPQCDERSGQDRCLASITSSLDIYVNGSRIIFDEPAPGEIFGTAPGKVFFLKHDPSRRGWTIMEYIWTDGSPAKRRDTADVTSGNGFEALLQPPDINDRWLE